MKGYAFCIMGFLLLIEPIFRFGPSGEGTPSCEELALENQRSEYPVTFSLLPPDTREAYNSSLRRNQTYFGSSETETTLCKIFGECLAKRLHREANKNDLGDDSRCYDGESSEFHALNTLVRATLGAVGETFVNTPLGQRLAEKVAMYSRVEYTKYRSEEKGKLYVPGNKSTKNGEKDYCWLLRFPVHTSSLKLRPSVELGGFFSGSELSTRFTNDELAIRFNSRKLDDFVSARVHLRDAKVHLGVNYGLEGLWYAQFSVSY